MWAVQRLVNLNGCQHIYNRKDGIFDMKEVWIQDEFIKLGQALKLAGLAGSGVDAKIAVQDGLVRLNGVVETRRGKKVFNNDQVSYNGESFVIKTKKGIKL
jgi:ribosome-associated protein